MLEIKRLDHFGLVAGVIAGLLMVMTLALMVYNVAQQRLRKAMEVQNETILGGAACEIYQISKN